MIDADRVHALLGYGGLVEALRRAHLGGMPSHWDRVLLEEPDPEGQPDLLIVIPVWQTEDGILVKITTSFPRNKQRYDVPTVNSAYVFLDGRTGVPQYTIDGEAMIFRKTSADSALGSQILSSPDARSLLMIGAGGLAPYLVRAHCHVRPSIREVRIWNRTAEAAGRLAHLLEGEGIAASVADDLEEALPRADIVSSATMTEQPLVRGALLRPGAHVDLVGSFTPRMREADDETLRRARLFVDHRQTTQRSGEFVGPFARGVIRPEDVRGDLFELCQGRVAGRTRADEVTLMKNGGGGHLDYFVTRYLIDRLRGEPSAPA